MLFNSYEFIFLFLPISLLVYFTLNSIRLTTASKYWLIFSSLFFYSWWNIIYLPLILISIVFNYKISQKIIYYQVSKNNYLSKKNILQIGLFFNIGLLIYFKYMDFFIYNFNRITHSDISLLNLALPLAISFFTLQQIAFLVDSYEGLVKEKNFLNYSIFVLFFPQLIAGPIVHHKEMMPQFQRIKNKIINYNNLYKGLFIFSIGLFKKVVIADTFAVVANSGFSVTSGLNLFEAWATSLSYTFQLYFDFSGYSDMAIGLALLFNIKLPINFNSPYKSTSIIMLWRRWHITLSNFINFYIYTPIVRLFDTFTFNKAMFATMIAFSIAGLWHGSSMMFLFFGFLHGVALVINQYWKKLKFKMHRILAWFITFNFFNITLIFFRAKDWDNALYVLSGMMGFNGINLPNVLEHKLLFLNKFGIEFGNFADAINSGYYAPFWIIGGFILVLIFKNSIEMLDNFKLNYKTSIFSGIAFSISVLYLNKISEFLYFNF